MEESGCDSYLLDYLQPTLNKLFTDTWAATDASQELIYQMRRVLLPLDLSSEYFETSFLNWIKLPIICCQAAGGDPFLALDVAAAWLLYYSAAHVLDNVEDKDEMDPWWRHLTQGSAINIATGLLISGSLVLFRFIQKTDKKNVANDICLDFHQKILDICSGQHLDLTLINPSLEQWWNIASAKSGETFALACRSGARLATTDSYLINQYSQFGYHLGLLIQILDDSKDFLQISPMEENHSISTSWPLPIAYALNVISPQERTHLQGLRKEMEVIKENVNQVIDILEKSGTSLYIVTEIKKHQAKALEALENAKPQKFAGEMLKEIIGSLVVSI